MIYLGMGQESNASGCNVVNVELDTSVHIKPWPEDHGDVVVPVSPWTRYVAIDESGLVCCYSVKPLYINKYNQWMVNGQAKVRCCGEVGLEGWGFLASESCVEVKL